MKPDFSLTQDNASTVATLCARLDGLPLAIELISARVKLLPPSALLERLSGRLLLQSDGLRDLEPRHRTLNAAIEWSYQLLSADEQTLFRRLGVFVGGWTLEAAEAVCLENLSFNLLDVLSSLIDKNLIKQETRSNAEPRLTTLETIREYALERLAANGELDDLRKRHADYFTTLAERAETEMHRTDRKRWMAILEAEYANFRVALDWNVTHWRLAFAPRGFWSRRSHTTEGRRWLTNALAQPGADSPAAADRTLRAWALNWLGTFCRWQGDFDASQPYYEESLTLFRELKEDEGIAEVLGDLGMLILERGDSGQARHLVEESLALRRETGDRQGTAQALFFLGRIALAQGQTEQAGIFLEESLIGMRALDTPFGIAAVLTCLALVALDQDDCVRAGLQAAEGLVLLRELGERFESAQILEVFACLAVAQGQRSEETQSCLLRSARLFGAAEAMREIIQLPILSFSRHFYERGVTALRAHFDETTLAAAWAEGRAMALEQAVEYALSE